jgi:hypothetical protein
MVTPVQSMWAGFLGRTEMDLLFAMRLGEEYVKTSALLWRPARVAAWRTFA